MVITIGDNDQQHWLNNYKLVVSQCKGPHNGWFITLNGYDLGGPILRNTNMAVSRSPPVAQRLKCAVLKSNSFILIQSTMAVFHTNNDDCWMVYRIWYS